MTRKKIQTLCLIQKYLIWLKRSVKKGMFQAKFNLTICLSIYYAIYNVCVSVVTGIPRVLVASKRASVEGGI